MLSRRFVFRPGVTIASAIALAILIGLGSWQLKRLQWKEDLIAQVEERVDGAPMPFDEAVRRAGAGEAMEYAPVVIDGMLDRNARANVFGSYDGEAGVYAFAPLTTASGETVYVNEGFIPQEKIGGVEAGLPSEEMVSVTGLFRAAEKPVPPASWFQLKGKSVDGLWYIRDPRGFAAEAGVETGPYYIDRAAVAGRDWPKGGTTRIEFSNRHLEYALTWFGLGAALIGVWLAFSLKKPY